MLRAVSLLSFLYDTGLGLTLLFGAAAMAATFGIPPPVPAVLGDTNGILLLGIGIGYLLPLRDPVRWRTYLWVMGPFVKGLGAAVFLRDAVLRDSPPAFLLFALSDGALAVITLLALWRERPGRPPAAVAPVA